MSAAFQDAPSLPFRQAWREGVEEGFRPGTARFGWRDGGFCVWATLEDEVVFTQATEDHQRMWLLGDVVEIFLKERGREDYWEFHVTPNGRRLQLHFASAKEREFERSVVREPVFGAMARVTPAGWEVCAEARAVPLAAGQELLVSVSRYDYRDAESEPVLSSTSAHKKVNYHRQHEWAEMRLVG